PVVDGSRRAAWRAVRTDARQHPSPNAGVVEAAVAGARGVRLGGRHLYGGEVEYRGTLGDGRAVQVSDIDRAARLGVAISVAALGLAMGLRAVLAGRRP
ncbi:MAG: cobalamin biosynthesis protein, partial [Propionibacteriaceae bacterium]